MLALSAFYEPSWVEAGDHEQGGVRLVGRKTGRLRLRPSDFRPNVEADESLALHPEWWLFKSSQAECLSFEWEWVTNEREKYWHRRWAKAGVAFNGSFSPTDARGARFLVIWCRTSHPHAALDLELQLRSAAASGAPSESGAVSLREQLGRALPDEWTRAVVPLSAFPELERLDLGKLECLLLSVAGDYPENEPVFVQLSHVYLSSATLLPRVRNAGYWVEGDELLLVWDEPGEGVERYVVRAGPSSIETVGCSARLSVAALEAAGTKTVSIEAEAGWERSAPALLDVELTRPSYVSARLTLGKELGHEISPYVFGANYARPEDIATLGVTVQRWGGNDTTKYNWQADVTNAGSDWYFLNTETRPGLREDEKRYYLYVESALRAGADVNFTIPIGRWIARPHPGEGRYGSFPLDVYPDQQESDGAGHGNGRSADGTPIWDNDPTLALTANSPGFQGKLVQTLRDSFGGAGNGGVRFYSLDNEPGLWNVTHRDAYSKGLSAEELAKLSETYAATIKSVDPEAAVIGFCAWGVMDLAGSNVDYTPPGGDGYRRYGQFTDESDRWSERKAHGDKSQLVYLLESFQRMEEAHGRRLVDLIDVHVYPEIYAHDRDGNARRLCENLPFDPHLARLQFEALREWYDPRFEPGAELSSWTAAEGNRARLWDDFHPIIPALKRIVEGTYPGTKLAINEYVTGSEDYFHGSLLRVMLLGIFLQEGLYMAQSWTRLRTDRFLHLAHRLYRNYDGRGSSITGRFVRSRTSSADLASYAVKSAERLFVVLVNKSRDTGYSVRLPLPGGTVRLTTYQLAESLNLRLLERARPTTPPSTLLALAPFSATLAVIE
jgi:hypothetical protein